MPDFANYSVTVSGTATANNVPRYIVTCDVINSSNGNLPQNNSKIYKFYYQQ